MPPLISRPEWGGGPFASVHMGPVETVFVHHSVTPAGQEIKAAMRDLERHAIALGHRAIDYSFVCHQDGQRAVGRGWWSQGGHTINNNSTSYGICAIGNFAASDRATDALIDAYADTIREGIAIGAIHANPRIRPHSDVFATACPGTLRDVIPEIARRVATGSGTPAVITTEEEVPMLVHTLGAEAYYQIGEQTWTQLTPAEAYVLATGGAKFTDLTPQATQVLQVRADANRNALRGPVLRAIVALGQFIANLFPKKAERAGGAPEA